MSWLEKPTDNPTETKEKVNDTLRTAANLTTSLIILGLVRTAFKDKDESFGGMKWINGG